MNKLIFIFFFFLFSLFPFLAPEIHAWDAIPAAILKETWDKIDFTTNGIILTTLKQAGMRIVMQQYSKIVGGTMGSGAMFITNWESFLITEPQMQARAIVNAKIDQALSGRGSSSMYIPRSYGSVLGASDSKASEGFFGGKVLGDSSANGGDNYYGDMQSAAESAVSDQEPQLTYEGNPSQMFASGNFRNYNSILYDLNLPILMRTYSTNMYDEQMENQKQIAFAQSVAYQGYKGTMKNGIVVTPGSLISQTMANVQDIGNKIMAAAQHPEEVISSAVANVVTQAAVMGIGAVSNVVDRQVNQVTSKALNQVNSQIRSLGPGALYNRR